MHHAYEAKFIPNVQPGSDGANIKLQVNVFFHETKHGLLDCEENKTAVREIKKKLLDVPISKRSNTSGNVQDRNAFCCFL